MLKLLHISFICFGLLFCSCTQIVESPIEGENWQQSGSHKDKSWKIVKKGDHLHVLINEKTYQVYPNIKINDLSIQRCGISSTGPQSQDHGVALPENGTLYQQSPYAYSFKRDSELHIITLSKEKSFEGEFYLQSTFSINLDNHEITLTDTIHNPSEKTKEAQFSYLIKSDSDLQLFQNYESIFPLQTPVNSDLNQWKKTDPIADMSGLRYDDSELILANKKLNFSSDELQYISYLNSKTLSMGTSFYQSRAHERILGRVALIEPYRDITFVTKIKELKDLPKATKEAHREDELESLESLNIK